MWRIVAGFLLALNIGGVLAAVGNRAAWLSTDLDPSVEEGAAVILSVVPDATISWIGWHDEVGDAYSPNRFDSTHSVGTRDYSVLNRDLKLFAPRFTAAGWHVVELKPQVFAATRDRMIARWTVSSQALGRGSVRLWTEPPPLVMGLTFAGWGIGIVIGCLAAVVVPFGGRIGLILLGALLAIPFPLASFALWLTGADVGRSLHLTYASPGPPIWFGYFPVLVPFGFQLG